MSGIQTYAQIESKAESPTVSPAIVSFSNFLKTLPDSTANKINGLQLNLAQTQDKLDQIQSQLLEEKTINGDIANPDRIVQIDSALENIGYLNQEMVALAKALLNLQSSSKIDYELAYIEESKQLIVSELDKLPSGSTLELDSEVTNSILANDIHEDLSDYDFEIHPETNIETYPDFNCEIITADTNNSNSTKYTQLSPIFTFTPEKLEEHFQGTSFIRCNAQLAKTENLYFINLEIDIQTKFARDTYGGIDKGSALRIELINGDKLLAYNVKRDYGSLTADEESVVYNVIYSLDSDDIKSLSKFDLDKLGIIWSTGYEDYEVYHTDFIINHLNCLKN